MTEIGYLGALLGGVLALASPCSAMLLPAFFAYAFDRPAQIVARTGWFYVGLLITLVPLGVAASSVGRVLTVHRDTVILVSGAVLIVLGLMQIAGGGFGSGLAQRAVGRIRVRSGLSVVALGAVYGLAGFCAGPILGSVLAVSAAGGDPVYGGVLLALYALGMVVPLLLLALAWKRFDLGRRGWLRGREIRVGRLRTHTTSVVSGLLFVAIGLLFVLTDGTGSLASPLGVDAQFDAQLWATRVGDRIGDVGLVVLAGAAVLLLIVRRRRHATRPGADARAAVEDRDAPAGGLSRPEA